MDRTSGGGQSRNISCWFPIWSQSLAGGCPPTRNHQNHQLRHISIIITTTNITTSGPPPPPTPPPSTSSSSPSPPPTSVYLKAPVCLATKDHAHFAAFTDQRQIKASTRVTTITIITNYQKYIKIYLGHGHHNNFQTYQNCCKYCRKDNSVQMYIYNNSKNPSFNSLQGGMAGLVPDSSLKDFSHTELQVFFY